MIESVSLLLDFWTPLPDDLDLFLPSSPFVRFLSLRSRLPTLLIVHNALVFDNRVARINIFDLLVSFAITITAVINISYAVLFNRAAEDPEPE